MQWANKLFGYGLLDPELEKRLSEQQRQQMGNAAMMDAGLAMLANSGYSSVPTTLGQGLAQGVYAGRQSYAAQAEPHRQALQAQAQRQQQEDALTAMGITDPQARAFAIAMGVDKYAQNEAEQRGKLSLEREKAKLKPADSYRMLSAEEKRQYGIPANVPAQINDRTNKLSVASSGTTVNVNTGQKDVNWGEPPKDTVWARDASGNVVTELDPATGARRPVVLPVKGSQGDVDTARSKEQAANKALASYNTIDQMLNHPGLNTAVGLSAQIDPRNYIYGSDAKGAQALIDQAQGQAFLQAFESLKGGGQITQVEGEKATQAIARLQRSQSDADFRAAAEELKQIAAKAYERATGRSIAPDDDEALINKYLGQ